MDSIKLFMGMILIISKYCALFKIYVSLQPQRIT